MTIPGPFPTIPDHNTKRPHQGIEHQMPMTKYAKIAA